MVADALSRRPGLDEHPVTFSSLSTCQPLLIQQLQDFYSTHDVSQALIIKFSRPSTNEAFSVRQGILYFKWRLFVPAETDLWPKLIAEFHGSPLGGHSGFRGTMQRLTAAFAWPYMAREVKKAVCKCPTC